MLLVAAPNAVAWARPTWTDDIDRQVKNSHIPDVTFDVYDYGSEMI